MDILDRAILSSAEIIAKGRVVVAFTGAGISADSGIPTFRGEGGLWLRYDPAQFTLSYLYENPRSAWELYLEIFQKYFLSREPNEGHRALVELQDIGKLDAIITQNIDSLHERAGAKNVLKLHGDINYVKCINCNQRYLWEEIFQKIEETRSLPPLCEICGGLLKPDVVLFEDELDQKILEEAYLLMKRTDVLLIIGTSGEIWPASGLPFEAKDNGAVIIEVNYAPSNYTRTITDYFLEGRSKEILPKLTGKVKDLLMSRN